MIRIVVEGDRIIILLLPVIPGEGTPVLSCQLIHLCTALHFSQSASVNYIRPCVHNSAVLATDDV